MVPYPPCSICSSFSPTTYYSLSWQTTMWYWECAVKRGSWGAPCVELQGVTPIQLLDAMLTHPCFFSAPLTHGFITTVNNGCSHINHHKAEEKRQEQKKNYFWVPRFKTNLGSSVFAAWLHVNMKLGWREKSSDNSFTANEHNQHNILFLQKGFPPPGATSRWVTL